MLVWRGYGFLVALFVFVGVLAGNYGAEALWGSPIPVEKKQWAQLLGTWIAAALVYGLHVVARKSSEPQTVVDKKTGVEMQLVKKHDLFYIPLRFWPAILFALGLLFFYSPSQHAPADESKQTESPRQTLSRCQPAC